MSEKVKFDFVNRKTAAVALATAMLLGSEGCSEIHNLVDDETKTITLSEQQAQAINEQARSRGEIDHYYMLHPNQSVMGGVSEGPDGQSARLPFKLGGRLHYLDLLQDIYITPTVKDEVAYVTHTSTFDNMAGSSSSERVLANPNQAIFGSDDIVSKEELKAFYADEATVVVSYSYEHESPIDPICNFEFTLDDRTMRYRDDDSEGCPPDDVTKAEIVEYLL